LSYKVRSACSLVLSSYNIGQSVFRCHFLKAMFGFLRHIRSDSFFNTHIVVAVLVGVFQSSSACTENIFLQQIPQFQIIAAAKTGSTSLYSYLCQHPSIKCLAKKKELNLLRSIHVEKSAKVLICYFFK